MFWEPVLLLAIEFLILSPCSSVDVLNSHFSQSSCSFFTDIGSVRDTSIYLQEFASTGNIDDVSLNINIGTLRVNASINPDFSSLKLQHLSTVHLFQKELRENDAILHFLCHSLGGKSESPDNNSQHLSTCCIIKVIASNRHFFTGCLIENWSSQKSSTCHASIHIESRAWNDSRNNELDISYQINTVNYMRQSSENLNVDSVILSRQCLTPIATQMSNFKFLSKVSLKKFQRDEVREIGRNIRLDIPTRELKDGEYFNIPVRTKKYADVAEFTLR